MTVIVTLKSVPSLATWPIAAISRACSNNSGPSQSGHFTECHSSHALDNRGVDDQSPPQTHEPFWIPAIIKAGRLGPSCEVTARVAAPCGRRAHAPPIARGERSEVSRPCELLPWLREVWAPTWRVGVEPLRQDLSARSQLCTERTWLCPQPNAT